MTKNKYLTNQQLLKELEKRLSDFTHNEMKILLELTLMNLPNQFKEKLLQLDPQQANDWMKKSIQQVENKKLDKLTEEIKKSLEKK
jgi:hypothetical protein